MNPENKNGGLWLTSMGRIVLDNHNWESFCEPRDRKIMEKKELLNGIRFEEFMQRIAKLSQSAETKSEVKG